MPRNRIALSLVVTLLFPLMFSAVGCQTTVGGQTLPSATYLSDDVQYFPAGPEFKLTNQVQAMEEYKLDRERLRAGFDADTQ